MSDKPNENEQIKPPFHRHLGDLPTGETAFKEIAGDPNKHIIYYKNGVLTTKDGLGNITRYKDDELYYKLKELKRTLEEKIMSMDMAPELKKRLIDSSFKIIDERIAENEE